MTSYNGVPEVYRRIVARIQELLSSVKRSEIDRGVEEFDRPPADEGRAAAGAVLRRLDPGENETESPNAPRE